MSCGYDLTVYKTAATGNEAPQSGNIFIFLPVWVWFVVRSMYSIQTKRSRTSRRWMTGANTLHHVHGLKIPWALTELLYVTVTVNARGVFVGSCYNVEYHAFHFCIKLVNIFARNLCSDITIIFCWQIYFCYEHLTTCVCVNYLLLMRI